jgi:arylsulfatase A
MRGHCHDRHNGRGIQTVRRINAIMQLRQIIIALFLFFLAGACTRDHETFRSNVVIIFLDDSGWADFEPFGELYVETPEVTRLAAEGCAYTNFHVPQAICSASRAALLTGCYPGRTRVFGAHAPEERGLDTTFATLGEVFGAAGYATAAFGKWHCGDQSDTRSHARGFDETCGLMYSNDMWKYHPENPGYWGQWPLRYWENGKVVIEEVEKEDQEHFTRWYTEHAVDFIRRHSDTPFLLYLAHNMPHVPLFCSEEFRGRSGKGLYWDVILELDWSIGQVNRALKDAGVENSTVVILTSDNGPWISYGDHAGRTPFREAKGTSFEGGVRSACVIKFPNVIKKGTVSDRAFGSVDLLPTLCHLAGIPLPENDIDGENVWDLVTGKEGAVNPHEYYAFSNNDKFEGVMSGNGHWKLHLPHPYRSLLRAGSGGMPGEYRMLQTDTALYDMVADPCERINVMAAYPDTARMLIRLAEAHKKRFYGE